MAQTTILTLRQAATRLQVSDRTVLELLSAGTLKGQKVGSQWRIRTADVDAYLNSQGVGKSQAEKPQAAGPQEAD